MDRTVTGEAVALDLPVARLATRAMAFTIDAAVLLAVGTGIAVAVAYAAPEVDDALAAALGISLIVLVLVVLPATIETLTGGRSLGKLAMGLRVVRDDGGPIRFRHALVRALAGVFVDFVTTSGAGAVICSVLHPRAKRIGDVLAGTVVVRERAPGRLGTTPTMPPPLRDWAAGAELTRLPDHLATAARTLLGRWRELGPQAREDMAQRLATEVSGYVTPLPPPGTPAAAYLAAVVAERHRRELARWEQPPHR